MNGEKEKVKETMEYAPAEYFNMATSKMSSVVFSNPSIGSPDEIRRRMDEEAERGNKGISVRVSPKNEKKEVCVHGVFFGLEDLDGVVMSKTTDAFDYVIFSGVCSIFCSGQTYFTLRQLFRVMTGSRDTGIRNDAPMIKEIDERLLKMKNIAIRFDWSEQAEAWNIDKDRECARRIDSYLLPLERSERIFANGASTVEYRILSEPALNQYSRAIGQYLSIKQNLLRVDVRMTKKSILICNYVIRRIEWMKNEKSGSSANHAIDIKTVSEQCGLPMDTPKKEKIIRDTVIEALRHFTDEGYIKGFERVVEKSGHIVSVEIKL